MKLYTIRSAFCESGMWPISCKTAVCKMRQYLKKASLKTPISTNLEDNINNSTNNDTDMLLPLQPATYFQCEIGGEE